MNWSKIEDVLFEGSKDDIKKLKCPECNNKIFYEYTPEYNSFRYGCKKCGELVLMNGVPIPNYAVGNNG